MAGWVEPLNEFMMYRIRYELPECLPLVNLIIPVGNGLDLLRRCITSVLRKRPIIITKFLWWIMDPTKARHELSPVLKSDLELRILRDDRPFNFSALNNAAFREARGDVLALQRMISRSFPRTGFPKWSAMHFSRKSEPSGHACCIPMAPFSTEALIWYRRGSGHANKGLPCNLSGYFHRVKLTQSVSAVTAACLVIRKELYEKVGGFNEFLSCIERHRFLSANPRSRLSKYAGP